MQADSEMARQYREQLEEELDKSRKAVSEIHANLVESAEFILGHLKSK